MRSTFGISFSGRAGQLAALNFPVASESGARSPPRRMGNAGVRESNLGLRFQRRGASLAPFNKL